MTETNKNSKQMISCVIGVLNNAINECEDTLTRERIEVYINGLKMFFMTDEEIKNEYFSGNNKVTKGDIDTLRNDRVRSAFYWVANNFDIIK